MKLVSLSIWRMTLSIKIREPSSIIKKTEKTVNWSEERKFMRPKSTSYKPSIYSKTIKKTGIEIISEVRKFMPLKNDITN